eukprot:TRINITY_DN10164_c0_g1_i2.p1 TRINITY_DN10164_c0_g1~~TRINITY_DN10164_c0_g1_i2.p1  ORF type:complete len:271 (-),score=74.67 TRINITY_DN10164_c0_g1_i2:202-1014(-)
MDEASEATRCAPLQLSESNMAHLLTFARQRIEAGQPAEALQAIVAVLQAQGGQGAVLAALHRARVLHQSDMAASRASDELAALFAQCALADAGGGSVGAGVGMVSGRSLVTENTQNIDFSSLSISPEQQQMQMASAMDLDTRLTGTSTGSSSASVGQSERERAGEAPMSAMAAGLPFSSVHRPDVQVEVRLWEEEDEHGAGEGGWVQRGQSGQQQRFWHPDEIPILAESGRLQVVADASSDGSSFECPRCHGIVSSMRRDVHLQYWCPNL